MTDHLVYIGNGEYRRALTVPEAERMFEATDAARLAREERDARVLRAERARTCLRHRVVGPCHYCADIPEGEDW